MNPVFTPMPHRLAVAGLVSILLLQGLIASRQKSPAFDEPPHIAAGLSYLATGRIQANPQHPPLLKEISGAFLMASGVRWPDSPEAEELRRGRVGVEWLIGNRILSAYGPDRVLFWARLPLVLLSACLGLVLYRWARELMGKAAALGGLFIYSLDPTMMAHSFLVTTDVGFAAFTVALMAALWRYAKKPGPRQAVLCGVCLGAALGSKFSAIFLVPVVATLVWAGIRERTALRLEDSGPNDPCPCGSGAKYKKCHGAAARAELEWHGAVGWMGALIVMFAVAAVALEVIYMFPRGPMEYVAGLREVNADHASNHMAYLAGELKQRFASYFVAAWLLKTPLASIALTVIGLATLLRRGTLTLAGRLFLFLPPVVLFAAYTIFSDDMGFRYVIPALPFLHMTAGAGLAALIAATARWKRAAACVLCLWLIVAAAGIYPDGLSYFNEAACVAVEPRQVGLDGGSRCGPPWLDDSNVDWGQGLKDLRAWIQVNAPGRPLRLTYFGSFPPAEYGIEYTPISAAELVAEPTPGLYAISAHLVAGTPAAAKHSLGGGAEWLRRIRPAAIVGHAYYIYDIR